MLRFALPINRVHNKFLFRNLHGLTGGQIVYKKLKENKVTNVWISTGGAVMPLVDAFYKGDIKYYLPSHEQSGGHSAAGYAKASGKPGISIVTSGPGFTNSLTPLTDAMNDSVPFILISGQVPINSMGSQAFQECPSVEMSKPVTKWSVCVDSVNKLPDVIDEAFKVATSGKPGSVHIDLPKCVTSNKFENEIKLVSKVETYHKRKIPDIHKNVIADLINNSEKPVIIAGQGCNNSYQLLREFVTKSNIPITTTIHAMGAFDEEHPLSLEFMGMHGNAAANYAVQESELIIALGTRFDDRITGRINSFAPKCFEAFKKGKGGIIHVNINSKEIKFVLPTQFNFSMDCQDFLEQIIPLIKHNNRSKWINHITNLKEQFPFTYNESSFKIKTQQVISEINNSLQRNNFKDYFVSTGVGNHQMMASQFIKWKYPKSFLTSGSLGTMGVGLPYAIGAQIANPNSLVIDIDGDGSFNHSLHELKSVNDYNLPIKIAVMNDSKLSMVKAWEKLFYNERYTATDLGKNPNYVKLAESFGIEGIKCSNLHELSATVDYFLNCKGPILCDFQVEPDLCLPLVAPGSSIDNMILPDMKNENDNIIKEMQDSNILPPG